MKVLYRISDNGYQKVKFANATKQKCLLNLLTQFPIEEVTVYMDKCVEPTVDFLNHYRDIAGLKVVPIQGGSSAQSFKLIIDEALKLPPNEEVYLVEDDYWHLDGSRTAILEGLQRANYVTLYDAPDKYVPASMGGNPLIEEDGADQTKVILTKSHHWRLTNSTTCTFATTPSVLREDYEIWKRWCFASDTQTHPNDFQCFLELREMGRALLSALPTLSTHCEPAWKAPLIDWDKEIV